MVLGRMLLQLHGRATSWCSKRFAWPSEVDSVVYRWCLCRFFHTLLALTTKIEHHTRQPHLRAYALRMILLRVSYGNKLRYSRNLIKYYEIDESKDIIKLCLYVINMKNWVFKCIL